jgi:hypothetical protein
LNNFYKKVNFYIVLVPAYSRDDWDGDGLMNWQEDLNGNGIVDPGETDPFNLISLAIQQMHMAIR